MKGELLFVDCVEEGGKNCPPVYEKGDENGAPPPIRFLHSPTLVQSYQTHKRRVCCWGRYEFISFDRELANEVTYGEGDGNTPPIPPLFA